MLNDDMLWHLSHRFDTEVVPLADRHYNRQKIGSPQFVPPGRCIVLKTKPIDAFWVTSWQMPEFAKHAWSGAWNCSAFRNEGKELSSHLIRQAIACTLAIMGEAPPEGMITFVNADKVKPKRDPGYCYLMAGFKKVGVTKVHSLVVLQLLPSKMPPAAHPQGRRDLFAEC